MNKKSIQLLTALSAGACFTAASAMGQVVIAAWNFNDNSTVPSTLLPVTTGSGTLTTNWATADLLSFTGSPINLVDGDVAGSDSAFRNGGTTGNPANVGNSLTFEISVPALESNEFVRLIYAGRTTGTGMRDLTWSYSFDGLIFDDLITVDHFGQFGANYGLVTVDFSSIAAVSAGGDFFVRGTFETQLGQSNPTSAGNTRFDNVQFQVIPEPSTYAAIVGALFLGLVIYRRRAR